ncbi:CSC1-like protein HYP1 isoform X4 [Vitis vinifera]|uniref:CSC1-like protein HYP1 isoform X4 n=1 Tax=Vitis vinifera TaxID=29760 RepID=UPI00053FB52A|nr:CSC1-like protein HYP1 isoform X4 [Vitis vinifera]|eukprot:XP_010661095.1 PREDICTED: CSC1-like protein HYP1 isoform X4 [Vitis vinifera]
MILSALLTSVGINLGLCFLFFTLYSILRKQPGNIHVYAPRLVAEGKSQRTNHFNLDRLLPSAGWVTRAWQPSEEDLLSTSGLDAVVFMRIFIFSLRVFTFAGIIGVFILLPINYLGNQLSIDFSDLPNKSLDSFSISNVDNGSNRLWIHFSAAYVFTGVVCYLLYFEYSYISSKRIAWFYHSKPQPHQFTILVSGIPVSSGSRVGESVESFFTKYHPSTYLSHTVVRRTNKLQKVIDDAEKLYRTLGHLKSKRHTQQRFRRDGFLGLSGRRVDLLDQYEKKLEDLEDNLRMEQSSLAGEEVRAAFVSFKSRFGAAIALHIQQGIDPTEWVTERAPEPQDVYWPFFSASFLKRWICKLVFVVAYILLTVSFLIPVVIVQGLTHLDQLEVWFPFLRGVLTITFVSQVITGYLPSLILQLFLSLVPPIMIIFSSMQGYISFSKIQKSACTKMLWFTIWNIFFANVLSGSVLYQVNIILEPKEIPKILAEVVPAQLLNVFAPKYETGGKFWPIVHNSTIFSLVLMHIIAIGIFGLKKLPLASSLTIPLPVLTLLFNEFCRKRFLPIFRDYSAECLINKDREDQRDPTMVEFRDKLVTAYQDPALKPIQYSGSIGRLKSPLLHSAVA